MQVVKKQHGRAGGIRTLDLLDPNEALYQAEPRPDIVVVFGGGGGFAETGPLPFFYTLGFTSKEVSTVGKIIGLRFV